MTVANIVAIGAHLVEIRRFGIAIFANNAGVFFIDDFFELGPMFLLNYNAFFIDRYPRANAILGVHNNIVANHHTRNEDLPVFFINDLNPLYLIWILDYSLVISSN